MAVAALPDPKPARLEFMPLTETPLVFIAPRPIKQIDFAKESLIVPQTGVARQRLDLWLKQQGVVPRISTEVSGNEALIAMVRLGTGIGIVPLLALERSPLRNEVDIVRKAPKLAPYVVGLCVGKRNLKRPAVQAMWQLAKTL
jgi:LysR family positive regulator for ilvC